MHYKIQRNTLILILKPLKGLQLTLVFPCLFKAQTGTNQLNAERSHFHYDQPKLVCLPYFTRKARIKKTPQHTLVF